jgi:hypothetical protein
MANPYFYLYYTEAGPLTAHDFGRNISDCYPLPTRSRVDSYGGTGVVSSMLGPAAMRVVIRRDRTSDTSLVRMWRNVEDHLLAGGRVGFSWNHAKSWAGWLHWFPQQGDTLLYSAGNAFSAWSASAVLAAGDEVVIEQGNPAGRREVTTFSSINAGNQITIETAMNNTFEEQRPLIRYAGFFPALFLPQDQINKLRITSDRGITWELDLELEVDQALYSAVPEDSGSGIAPGSIGLRGTTGLAGAAGMSLMEMLGRTRTGGAAAASSSSWRGSPSRYGRI